MRTLAYTPAVCRFVLIGFRTSLGQLIVTISHCDVPSPGLTGQVHLFQVDTVGAKFRIKFANLPRTCSPFSCFLLHALTRSTSSRLLVLSNPALFVSFPLPQSTVLLLLSSTPSPQLPTNIFSSWIIPSFKSSFPLCQKRQNCSQSFTTI